MATQYRTEPAGPGYDDDLAGWAYDQSRLLLALRPAGVDWANIAEELKDLGNSQFKALSSALQVVIEHMLKRDMQPVRRGNSWAASIRNHRDHANYELKANPSFRSRINEALEPAWRRGVADASAAMDIPLRDMPRANPYTWDDIMTRPFEWPEDQP